jgi:hypothetical protein
LYAWPFGRKHLLYVKAGQKLLVAVNTAAVMRGGALKWRRVKDYLS